MGTLYLVRHGQASFGAEDYDQLSDLGRQQSRQLGAYLQSRGLSFERVLTGSLRRHAQTLEGICEGAGWQLTPEINPALNEYDSEAVIAAIHPHKLEKPDSPEVYRQHFRLLRDGLAQWMAGVVTPHGMPSYEDWQQGISDVLHSVRHGGHERVLLVSSGGPISTAVGHILGTSPETTIDLNMRIRNSSLTEFVFTPKRHALLTFNALPHLEAHADWVTYA